MPRPAKVAPKAAPSRKTRKPSSAAVFILTLVGIVVVHFLFCLLVKSAADKLTWHTPGWDADVQFGEAQFTLNAFVSFIPFDVLFGFAFAVILGFMIRLPFFRDRVYHTILDVKKRLMLQLSANADEVESIIRNDPENNTRLLARREDINIEGVQSEIMSINGARIVI